MPWRRGSPSATALQAGAEAAVSSERGETDAALGEVSKAVGVHAWDKNLAAAQARCATARAVLSSSLQPVRLELDKRYQDILVAEAAPGGVLPTWLHDDGNGSDQDTTVQSSSLVFVDDNTPCSSGSTIGTSGRLPRPTHFAPSSCSSPLPSCNLEPNASVGEYHPQSPQHARNDRTGSVPATDAILAPSGFGSATIGSGTTGSSKADQMLLQLGSMRRAAETGVGDLDNCVPPQVNEVRRALRRQASLCELRTAVGGIGGTCLPPSLSMSGSARASRALRPSTALMQHGGDRQQLPECAPPLLQSSASLRHQKPAWSDAAEQPAAAVLLTASPPPSPVHAAHGWRRQGSLSPHSPTALTEAGASTAPHGQSSGLGNSHACVTSIATGGGCADACPASPSSASSRQQTSASSLSMRRSNSSRSLIQLECQWNDDEDSDDGCSSSFSTVSSLPEMDAEGANADRWARASTNTSFLTISCPENLLEAAAADASAGTDSQLDTPLPPSSPRTNRPGQRRGPRASRSRLALCTSDLPVSLILSSTQQQQLAAATSPAPPSSPTKHVQYSQPLVANAATPPAGHSSVAAPAGGGSPSPRSASVSRARAGKALPSDSISCGPKAAPSSLAAAPSSGLKASPSSLAAASTIGRSASTRTSARAMLKMAAGGSGDAGSKQAAAAATPSVARGSAAEAVAALRMAHSFSSTTSQSDDA